jgi:hypothetical protein
VHTELWIPVLHISQGNAVNSKTCKLGHWPMSIVLGCPNPPENGSALFVIMAGDGIVGEAPDGGSRGPLPRKTWRDCRPSGRRLSDLGVVGGGFVPKGTKQIERTSCVCAVQT